MKKITRSMYDRKLAGVCGGLGKLYNIDSNFIRVIFLILCGYIPPISLIYVICIFIIPKESMF